MKRARLLLSLLMATVLSLVLTVTVFAETTITILHTNDVHGRFEPSNTSLGIDTLSAIRAATENVILVDTGDTFHGLPFVNLNRGMDAVEMMNMAGYALFTPGNHDFNFGLDRLLELEAAADFGFISANVFRGDQLVFDATRIIEIDGVRLGFFGLAHPNTGTLTNPTNVVGITFGDPVEAARNAVAELQAQEVDVIIALAHLGSGARNEYRIDGYGIHLAEEVDGIDIIIDGHSHTLHEGGVLIGNALLVQSGDHLRNVGRVDVTVYEGEIVSLEASTISREYALANFEPDAEIVSFIADVRERQQAELSVVVAYLEEQLEDDNIRLEEMPLGNLVADALRWGTGAEVALANGGGIRDVLPAGEITIGHIYAVLPFGNNGVTLEITYAQLREVLEHAIHQMPASNGRFPQVSGMSFMYDVEAPEGDRILYITVNGRTLDLDDNTSTLIIATNNFIAAGGDGYTTFLALTILGEFGTLDELLIEYLAVADLSELGVEGRIVQVAGVPDAIQPRIEVEATEEETANYAVEDVVYEDEEVVEVGIIEATIEATIADVEEVEIPLIPPTPVLPVPLQAGDFCYITGNWYRGIATPWAI